MAGISRGALSAGLLLGAPHLSLSPLLYLVVAGGSAVAVTVIDWYFRQAIFLVRQSLDHGREKGVL